MTSTITLSHYSPEDYNESPLGNHFLNSRFLPGEQVARGLAGEGHIPSSVPTHTGGGKQFANYVHCNMPSFYVSPDTETGSDTDSDSAFHEEQGGWCSGGVQNVPSLINTLPNTGADPLYPSATNGIPDTNFPLRAPAVQLRAPNSSGSNNTSNPLQIQEPVAESHWFRAETSQTSGGHEMSVRVTASLNLKISASWQTGDTSVNFVVQPCLRQVDVNAMQM
ncbi:hypothetical protein BKA70DRAFT_1240997 [Coprinopsis sp. MPI-PUGE-AT-0042]|nr:hypothetical protein BKA70DRAFT_1240997 [Coprinopsis sp. MPI-PUGE-AT-0042]